MCQIIHIPKGIRVPEDKLKASILNNPDGYGLLVRDRGKSEVRKKAEKIRNPDEVMKLLEELNDVDKFIHLRFITKGTLSEDNCHPFTSFSNSRVSVHMMHNGTFQGVTPKGSDSDTKAFNEGFLKPLLSKYVTEKGRGDIQDPMFQSICEKYIGHNRVLLIPNKGLPVFLNEDKWTFEGGNKSKEDYEYAVANTYSFNPTHRTPTYSSNYYQGGVGTVSNFPALSHSKKNPQGSFRPSVDGVTSGDYVQINPATASELLRTGETFELNKVYEVQRVIPSQRTLTVKVLNRVGSGYAIRTLSRFQVILAEKDSSKNKLKKASKKAIREAAKAAKKAKKEVQRAEANTPKVVSLGDFNKEKKAREEMGERITETIQKKHGIEDLADLVYLSEEEMFNLIKEDQRGMAILISDLAYLYSEELGDNE